MNGRLNMSALSINMSVSEGYNVYEFEAKQTRYTVVKKIGTVGAIDVWKKRLNYAGQATLKVYNSVQEFEKTAKCLKGISLLITE